jgi:uncharacterized membrane protein
MSEPILSQPMPVLIVLIGLLAALFFANTTAAGQRLFRYIPLLVFAYFLPTALSNSGVIPKESSFALYGFVNDWLLPASLVLMILAVDLPAIRKLGRNAGLMFLIGTATIIIGGPLAVLLFGWALPESLGEEAWKGLAALSGSWIGGGANFVAVGRYVEAKDSTLSLMVVADVAVANIWMAFLLNFANKEKAMDDAIDADRKSLDECREKAEAYQSGTSQPTTMSDLLLILFLGFGATGLARWAAPTLVEISERTFGKTYNILNEFTWVIVIASLVGFALSYTPLRRLDGAGASAVGSAFLYILVTTIGAKAEFSQVFDPKNAGMLLVVAAWMGFHALFMLMARRYLKAPIFFMAVGSQANVGGAASAPIVATAFHPSLAPVGVLLAILGYLLGVFGGIVAAGLLKLAYGVWH